MAGRLHISSRRIEAACRDHVVLVPASRASYMCLHRKRVAIAMSGVSEAVVSGMLAGVLEIGDDSGGGVANPTGNMKGHGA
jgi:hypothetical protein